MASASYFSPPLNATFGELLQAFRVKARLSQKQLAKRAGCSQSFISQIEAGRKQVHSPDQVRWLASGLDVDHDCTSLLFESVGFLPPQVSGQGDQDAARKAFQRILYELSQEQDQAILEDILNRILRWRLYAAAKRNSAGRPALAATQCTEVLSSERHSPLLTRVDELLREISAKLPDGSPMKLSVQLLSWATVPNPKETD